MPFGKPGSTITIISEKIHIHGASLSEQQTTNLSWHTTGFGTVTRA